MNFEFPEELQLLRDTARRFLYERSPASVARRVMESGENYDVSLWREMGAMGWIGASIPEEYGGGGLGRLPICVLAEELGRALAPVPFSSSVYLAAEALMLFGSSSQKQEYLPRLACGDAIATFAYVEKPGPFGASRQDTRVVDGYLSGQKLNVPDGLSADLAIVAVRADQDEPSLQIVLLAEPGVSRSSVETIDPSRGHARIDFQNVRAEPLPGAFGDKAIQMVLNRAAILMAFEQIGVAQAAMEMARDYANDRFAFGRSIGSFQAIKHKIVDIYVAVELARSNAYFGAWALESEAVELPIAAATSRVAACDAGWIATKENIQVHGGMGFTWELDCHLYYRRAKLLGLALGSGRDWKRKLINHLIAPEMLGASNLAQKDGSCGF